MRTWTLILLRPLLLVRQQLLLQLRQLSSSSSQSSMQLSILSHSGLPFGCDIRHALQHAGMILLQGVQPPLQGTLSCKQASHLQHIDKGKWFWTLGFAF